MDNNFVRVLAALLIFLPGVPLADDLMMLSGPVAKTFVYSCFLVIGVRCLRSAGRLFSVGENTTLSEKLQFFRTDFDRYEGSLNDAALDLQRRISKNFNIGVGYNIYGMKLTPRDSDVNGDLKMRHQRPPFFLATGF